ncbi:Methyl-CpG-binding domain protein 5 [Eumeta japonica]|uniref:Methyl-CpG-binding domain protein 5 n=1 Tax=Eumeta variegata TaxID=151549 RepID=A0A4C1XAZ7_EUMVA|nr:Methyl-CpG-binding domain protein 5 [Eumeta japonica]
MLKLEAQVRLHLECCYHLQVGTLITAGSRLHPMSRSLNQSSETAIRQLEPPSGTALNTLPQLREYLQTAGTCKCGLPCPLRPETAFSFDPKLVHVAAVTRDARRAAGRGAALSGELFYCSQTFSTSANVSFISIMNVYGAARQTEEPS